MDKRIFLIGFLLLLLGAANAVKLTGDYSLETDCVVPAKATYTLYNDSGRTQTYTIRAIGENSNWININGVDIGEEPLSITLHNRESEQLYAFVKPQTCYIEPGNYTVTIEASNGETISKEIEVEVLESRLLHLAISPAKQQAAQCEETEYEVTVKNLGERSETVSLSVEGLPAGWATLSISETRLQKNETRTAKLVLKSDCDAKVKEYQFAVKAALQDTTFSTEKNASLQLQDRQKIEITSQALQACAEKETSSKIKIRNNGLFEDTLRLSVEGLDWASLPAKLTLKAGEEKQVLLVFSKTNAEKGTHDFSVKAHSTKFGKDTEKGLQVELQECYRITIDKVLLNGLEAGERPSQCIESTPKYTFALTNNGIEEVETEVRVAGLDSVISPSTFSIKKGETKEVSVELDLSREQPGEKQFTLVIKGENFSTQQDYQVVAEDCYNLRVEWGSLEGEINLDANCKSQPFTVKVENQGTKSQPVLVSVSGPDWVYFEPQKTGVEAGKQQQIYFYFAPSFDTKEGKHSARVSLQGEERTYSRTIEMNVQADLTVELEEASIQAEVEVQEVIEKTETVVRLRLLLSNDSNVTIEVKGLSAKDNEAEFQFKQATLQPTETVEVPMTLHLKPGDENQFAVTLSIDTDKGILLREIEVDLETKEQLEEQLVPVGLFGLAGLGDLVLAGIVIAAIVVFAAIALSAEVKVRKRGSGLTNLVKEVEGLPGKKLEEIGKRKKSGRPSKNLQDIVKRVKKKHKKKPVRKRKKK